MNDNIRILLRASMAIAPFALATQVFAANQTATAGATLEEIVVTAQRREEDLQTVPIAVTSVSATDLAASNVKSVQDLTTLVSGFIGPGDNGMQSPHLRGIGGTVVAPGIERSVALYVDGVYIGAPTPGLLALNNVQQIDVLKGPQGTLFGRNTTGGLIQITTRSPSDTPAVEAGIGYANYNTSSTSVYLNGPVSSNVFTNLAVQASTQGDGWGKNLLSGKDVYRVDLNLALRNKWEILLADTTKLQLVADYEKRNETGTFAYRPIVGSTNIFGYTSTVSNWDVNSNADQNTDSEAYGLSGRLSHDLGFATLSDTIAYRHSKFNLLGFDSDKSPIDQFSVYWHTADTQWTNELQLASNASGPLKWTTGIFYFHALDDTHQPLIWGVAAPVLGPFGKLQQQAATDSITGESLAGYAQADYTFASATTLTAGFRYSQDKHSISGHNDYIVGGVAYGPGAAPFNPVLAPASFSKDSAVWRLVLSQRLSDDAMLYASYNRGAKAGGYNPVLIANKPYSDEQLDSYEAGSKLTFLDHRARLNLAAFYSKFQNIQVQAFQPAGPPLIYNGAGAKTYGLDVDFELQPVSDFKIRGTLESLHSEFTEFPNANLLLPLATGGYRQTTSAASGISVVGNPLPDAPKFTASIAPIYTIPVSYGSCELSATWYHSSGFTTTPGLEISQAAYNLLSASLQLTDSANRYYVQFWGANLGNEQVAMNLTISTTGTVVGLLAPRTFGVTVGGRFK